MAVHDVCRDPREWLGPVDSLPFAVLRFRALELTETQLPDLQAMLATARASLVTCAGRTSDQNGPDEPSLPLSPTPNNATHRPPTPPGAGEPPNQSPRSRPPNERTEQPVIDALYGLVAIGVEGLRAIEKEKRPTGERLAQRAIGRHCDGQFKGTLAHMVDLGWLGNGREHGLVGGYFLTPAGVTLVTKRK
jgi:hypothetical protein